MRACLLITRILQAALILLAVVALLPQAASAQSDPSVGKEESYLQLSIEQLMEVDVTSVSRSPQTLQTSAAAIAVVTNEDLRRSNADTIPEALRMVPGIYVGRETSNTWAVSSRGFTSTNSEKLLVQSDTRSVYTPLVSGVFWDVQNYVMEDIEKIEVIRGPGASLWGSNAVNGIISITTKDARDTQGVYAEAGGGSEKEVTTALRYGGRLNDKFYYRVFGRYFQYDDTFRKGTEQRDDWRMGHLGFRSDWELSADDTLTFQGDGYLGTVGQYEPSVTVIGVPGPEGRLESDVAGGNILARWRRRFNPDSELHVRAYYDRTDRDDPSFDDTLDTADLDLQHSLKLLEMHRLTWGINYRYFHNDNQGKGVFNLEPQSSTDHLVSGFIQDRIQLLETVELTFGAKLEHNDFSGFEFQPSVRSAWQVSPRHVLWGAVSRAVRVPTRLERDVLVNAAPANEDPLPRLVGNNGFDAEELIAYELGFRWNVSESVAFDLATFYNDYDKLESVELGEPFTEPDGRTILPLLSKNSGKGHGKGVELLAHYSPLPNWRLTASYSYLDLHLTSRGMDLNRGELLEGATPRHQLGLRSYLDLPKGWELDLWFRNISEIRSLPASVEGDNISDYAELDIRLGRRLANGLSFSIIGRNLLDDHHPEFGTPEARGEIERGVFAQISYHLP